MESNVSGFVDGTQVEVPSAAAVAPLLEGRDRLLSNDGCEIRELETGDVLAEDGVAGEEVGGLGTVAEEEANVDVGGGVGGVKLKNHGGTVVDESGELDRVHVDEAGETEELGEGVVGAREQGEEGRLGDEGLVEVAVHGGKQGLAADGGVRVGGVVVEAGGVLILEPLDLVEGVLVDQAGEGSVVDAVDVDVVKDAVGVAIVELGLGNALADHGGQALVELEGRLVEGQELRALKVGVGGRSQGGAELVALDPDRIGGIVIDTLSHHKLVPVHRGHQTSSIGQQQRQRRGFFLRSLDQILRESLQGWV